MVSSYCGNLDIRWSSKIQDITPSAGTNIQHLFVRTFPLCVAEERDENHTMPSPLLFGVFW